jgi:hypothetical protein
MIPHPLRHEASEVPESPSGDTRATVHRTNVRPTERKEIVHPCDANAGATEGTDLASSSGVRRLAARFHPDSRSHDRFVVVGHVICDPDGARIELADIAARSTKPFDSTRLHDKLASLDGIIDLDRATGAV